MHFPKSSQFWLQKPEGLKKLDILGFFAYNMPVKDYEEDSTRFLKDSREPGLVGTGMSRRRWKITSESQTES